MQLITTLTTIPKQISRLAQSKLSSHSRTRAGTKRVRIGIQGGEGSYNHQVLLDRGTTDLGEITDIQYLYTTAAVLEALEKGEIEYGQFAISNSRGGAVAESMAVIGAYRFDVIDQYDVAIQHALHIHPESTLKDITTIMTHPQVIQQCRETLQKRYPSIQLSSGEGNLIDHAAVAAAMQQGILPKTTAVMGPTGLADLYNLHTIAEGLNDDPHNTTSFVLVTT